jgi:hypothetical protein
VLIDVERLDATDELRTDRVRAAETPASAGEGAVPASLASRRSTDARKRRDGSKQKCGRTSSWLLHGNDLDRVAVARAGYRNHDEAGPSADELRHLLVAKRAHVHAGRMGRPTVGRFRNAAS